MDDGFDVALQATSVRLTSLSPGDSDDDLIPWGRTLDGVRVVGLGEATHGTREFFLLKHRLIGYLVREHGFTGFALEADPDGCRALDTFVTTGRGDPARALGELGYWTWHTEEVLDLLRWMRAHNTTVPPERAVRVVGVDPTGDARRSAAARDQAIAQAVLAAADDGPRKVVLWAHNGHIGTGHVSGRVPAAGAHLRAALGSAYYALGMTFHHGAFQTLRLTLRGLRGPRELVVDRPSRRSIEHAVHRAVAGDCLVDLRAATDDPRLHDWAMRSQPMRSYGSVTLFASVSPNQSERVVPARDFDGIVVLEQTTRARPLVHAADGAGPSAG